MTGSTRRSFLASSALLASGPVWGTRGPAAGDCLHRILEQMDYGLPCEAETNRELVERELRRAGLSQDWHMLSWNSAHGTAGCGPEDVKKTGGNCLFYCFYAR